MFENRPIAGWNLSTGLRRRARRPARTPRDTTRCSAPPSTNAAWFSGSRRSCLVEPEEPAVLDVLHERAEVVGEATRLAGEQRGGDEHGGALARRSARWSPSSARSLMPLLRPFKSTPSPWSSDGGAFSFGSRNRRLERPGFEPHVAQDPEVEAVAAREAEQRGVDAAGARAREHVGVHREVEELERAGGRARATARRRVGLAPSVAAVGVRRWQRRRPIGERFADPIDACSRRFSSRATPPIQMARLTPPVIAVAKRTSSVSESKLDRGRRTVVRCHETRPLAARKKRTGWPTRGTDSRETAIG